MGLQLNKDGFRSIPEQGWPSSCQVRSARKASACPLASTGGLTKLVTGVVAASEIKVSFNEVGDVEQVFKVGP